MTAPDPLREDEQRRLTVAEQYERWRFERLPLEERLTIVTDRAIANVKQRIDEIFAARAAILRLDQVRGK